MGKTFAFKRKTKSEKNKLFERQQAESEAPQGRIHDISRRTRFKRQTDILKSLNISLSGKMDELRLMPFSAKEDGIGSFFCDELDFLKTIHNSKEFYEFYLTVIDHSQNLALVIVNKNYICDRLLEKLDEAFFREFLGKLIVAFLRDCGEEAYEIFVQRIIPGLASRLNIVDLKFVDMTFTVLAAGLKFILKACLSNFEEFTKIFISNLIPKTNHHLRRFSTECLVFLIKKVRKVAVLKKNTHYLFTMKPIDIGLEDTPLSRNIRDDYFASLMFEVLKGDQGYLNEQAKDIVGILSGLLSNSEDQFMIKAINLIVENEFRFFMSRKHSETIGYRYELGRFMSDLYESRTGTEIVLQHRILKILIDILIFKDGKRFDECMIGLASECIKGIELSEEALTYIAKFMIVKHSPVKALDVLLSKEVLADREIFCLFRHLQAINTQTRTEVRKGFKHEKKNKIQFIDNRQVKIPEKCFEFLVVIAMKFIEFNISRLQDNEFSNFLSVFLTICEQVSTNVRLNLKSNIIALIKKNISNDLSNSFWKELVLIRLLRFSSFEGRESIEHYLMSKLETICEENAAKILKTDNYILTEFYSEDLEIFHSWKIFSTINRVELSQDRAIFIALEICKFLMGSKSFEKIYPKMFSTIEKLLSLDNLNYHLISLLKTLLLKALKLSSEKKAKIYQINYGSNGALIELSDNLFCFLTRALQSNNQLIRRDVITILEHSDLDTNKKVLNFLSLINIKNGDFESERGICMDISTLEQIILKEKISDKDALIIANCIIGISSFRVATIIKPLKSLLHALSTMNTSAFSIGFNAIVSMNRFYAVPDYSEEVIDLKLAPQDMNQESDMLFDSEELFKDAYHVEVDSLDNYTHFIRYLEIFPHALGLRFRSKKDGGNEKAIDDGEESEGHDMEQEQDNQDIAHALTKKEATEKLKIQNRIIFDFFRQFLIREIKDEILPSLKLILDSPDQEITTKYQAKQSDYDYFEEVIRSQFRREEESDVKALNSSRVNRLKLYTRIVGSMKKIASSGFADKFYNLLLELIKYPDGEYQTLVLDCISKTQIASKIIRQYIGDIKQLASKESFKDKLLGLNVKIKEFEEMEKDAVIPIVNAMLFRKLVDKKGIGSFKNLNSIRDFVLDCVKNFRKKDVDNLLLTIFCSFGCQLTETTKFDVRSLVSRMPISRLTGLLEMINNLIKKLLPEMKVHLPYIQNFVIQCIDYCNTFKMTYKDEIKNLRSEKKEEITEREKALLHFDKNIKSLKKYAMTRITTIFSYYIDTDLNEFAASFYSSCKEQITNLPVGTFTKTPQILKTIGCWFEIEHYKGYFFDYPEILSNTIKLFANHNLTVPLFEDICRLVERLTAYGVSSQYEEILNMKERVAPYIQEGEDIHIEVDGHKLSNLGYQLMNRELDNILDSLATFFTNSEKRLLKQINKAELKRLNSKMIQLCMHISFFCRDDESSNKLYNIVKRFWDVDHFNKKTDQPHYMVKTADELKAIEREREIQQALLGLMVNLAPRVSKIEEFFNDVVLKFVSTLGNLRMRALLKGIFESIVKNPHFAILNIQESVALRISHLFQLQRNLSDEDLNYDDVLALLVESDRDWEELSSENKNLLGCLCASWSRSEDLSIRTKSVDVLIKYIDSIHTKEQYQFYRTRILDSIVRYFSCHYGREGQLRSALTIIKYNSRLALRLKDIVEVQYSDVSIIDSNDKEQDFFELAMNLKINKRARAFRNLNKAIENGATFSGPTIKSIFKGLLEYFVFEYWSETTRSSNAYSNERIDRVRNILVEVFKVYGKLVGMLSLPQYIRFLKDLVRGMGKPGKSNDTILKLVCSALDSIDPNIPDVLVVINREYAQKNQESIKGSYINTILSAYSNDVELNKLRIMSELQPLADKEDLENGIEFDENDPIVMDEENVTELRESQIKSLKMGLLAPLKRNLSSKDEKGEDVVRSEVALAIVKLIRRLPIKMFNAELIGVIHRIGKTLKSKEITLRDNARNILSQIVQELGPYFLGFVVKEIKHHLSKGFEIHVRNFTVFKILEILIPQNKELPRIEYGAIDYCVPELAAMFIEEIIGELANEKEVKEIRTRSKEFLRNKGSECFKKIATRIDFTSDALNKIIDVVENTFKQNELKGSLSKFDHLLDEITLGLSENETVNMEALFLWIKNANQRGLKAIKPKSMDAENEIVPEIQTTSEELRRYNMKKTFEIQEGAANGKSIFKIMSEKRDIKTIPFGRVVSLFSLTVFYRILRTPLLSLDFENEEIKSKIGDLLEPISDQLIHFLGSGISKLMNRSLEILSYIIDWPVYSIVEKGRKFLKLILRIFEKSETNDLDMVQSCFKMMKNIIYTNKDFLQKSQISEIYNLVSENLYLADWVTEPLHCLNALISEGLIKPKLYDIMDEVISNMIKSMDKQIQALCKLAVFNYVQNAPLSDQLVEKFLLKLINNFGYEDRQGRQAVIEVTSKIVERFPLRAYTEHIDMMIMGLATSIVNEGVFPLKQQMKSILSQILLKIQSQLPAKLEEHKEFMNRFLQDESDDTKRAGVVLAESMLLTMTPDKAVSDAIVLCTERLENIGQEIQKFYIEIKEEKELSDMMKNTPWKNIAVDENAKDVFVMVKGSKDLICDCLFAISTFTKQCHSEKYQDILLRIGKAVFKIRHHPDEDIQLLVFDLIVLWCTLDHMRAAISSDVKSVIKSVLGAVKGDHLTVTNFVGKIEHILRIVYITLGEHAPDIRENCLSALDNIAAINLKFYKAGKPVYSKILGFLDILIKFSKHIDRKIYGEEMALLIQILLRFSLNGNFTQNKELDHLVNVITEECKDIAASEEDFLMLHTASKKKILEAKASKRQQEKTIAVTDPEAAAKLKILRKLRKRERVKEKYVEMKTGTLIPTKKRKTK